MDGISFLVSLAKFTEIEGPEGTPYSGGVFHLEVEVPDR